MTDNKQNFNEFLDILKENSKTSLITSVWIPSLKRTVNFKEMTAKQQKNILEAAIDSIVNKNTISNILYSIISENCEESDLVKSLTIVDKVAIIFAFKSQISEKINIVLNEDPYIEKDIKVEDIVNKFSNYNHPNSQIINFSKNSLVLDVEIGIPTISDDFSIDPHIYGNEIKEDNIEEIKEVITGAFLGESVKFIKEIKLNDSVLGYNSLSFEEKLKIVEKLPAILIKNILEKILDYKKELEEIYTISEGEYTKVIVIEDLLVS